jgi:hypothetical protein
MNAGWFRSSAAGRLKLVTWEVVRMKAILSARSRSCRSAPRPVFYALLVLVSIGASATAQSGLPAVASAKAGAAVTQTPQGVAFALDGAALGALPWVEGWTFRQNQALLTFRRSASDGPATELRFDRGGGHFTLKRQ